ncbi:glycosyltransferase family 2 protein [Chroogloeocystis siderophila]|jgi:glycosyltransferase involved in cell wall biosynthesis|uniref:Glucosyl transferase n=1 Tax=Chroogloeocystis siderophila 5.2 s.c.1 TaxID=247279 RepID=A0A1U7HDW5_9CHRO|nr:glycosyltransferase [Chroogloeocystis siderophila]OKH21787.1 glucosyl transferase [Chroogloeocystis siderophila 5.2 s.c.1]
MTQVLQQQSTPSSIEKTPLVSVIINNYNYGRFLTQAIESVLNQSYSNWELIVVDDGSTDNSREIIEAYKEKLIPILQKNAGQGEAINTGIAHAQGEIISFLDADDYFARDKLEKIVAGFCEHPEWVQISHCWISVNSEGQTVGRGSTILSQGDVRNLLLRWGRYAMGITSGLAYRRAVLQKVLPIPTRKAAAADTYLTVAVPFYGEVGCINEPLMFYRIHGSNKQAHNDNVPYLIQEREDTATFINQASAKVGLAERFDLLKDVDYRSLTALQQGGVPLTEAIEILWLSLRESIAIGRSARDTLERVLRRGICTLFPSEGRAVLRLGLRGYLRFKLFGQ